MVDSMCAAADDVMQASSWREQTELDRALARLQADKANLQVGGGGPTCSHASALSMVMHVFLYCTHPASAMALIEHSLPLVCCHQQWKHIYIQPLPAYTTYSADL
jgi:hypothetical protein